MDKKKITSIPESEQRKDADGYTYIGFTSDENDDTIDMLFQKTVMKNGQPEKATLSFTVPKQQSEAFVLSAKYTGLRTLLSHARTVCSTEFSQKMLNIMVGLYQNMPTDFFANHADFTNNYYTELFNYTKKAGFCGYVPKENMESSLEQLKNIKTQKESLAKSKTIA